MGWLFVGKGILKTQKNEIADHPLFHPPQLTVFVLPPPDPGRPLAGIFATLSTVTFRRKSDMRGLLDRLESANEDEMFGDIDAAQLCRLKDMFFMWHDRAKLEMDLRQIKSQRTKMRDLLDRLERVSKDDMFNYLSDDELRRLKGIILTWHDLAKLETDLRQVERE
jgi:hypothetical protein